MIQINEFTLITWALFTLIGFIVCSRLAINKIQDYLAKRKEERLSHNLDYHQQLEKFAISDIMELLEKIKLDVKGLETTTAHIDADQNNMGIFTERSVIVSNVISIINHYKNREAYNADVRAKIKSGQ